MLTSIIIIFFVVSVIKIKKYFTRNPDKYLVNQPEESIKQQDKIIS
jgi:hypothetical protein